MRDHCVKEGEGQHSISMACRNDERITHYVLLPTLIDLQSNVPWLLSFAAVGEAESASRSEKASSFAAPDKALRCRRRRPCPCGCDEDAVERRQASHCCVCEPGRWFGEVGRAMATSPAAMWTFFDVAIAEADSDTGGCSDACCLLAGLLLYSRCVASIASRGWWLCVIEAESPGNLSKWPPII